MRHSFVPPPGSDGVAYNLLLFIPSSRAHKERRQAEGYARTFYETTGDLNRPLVTIHNTLDPILPFEHELIYRALVAGEHNSRF